MKVFNLLLTALFLFSAALQYNDPDPLLWMAIYLSVALICVFAAFEKYNKWIILLVMAGILYEFTTLYPAFNQWIKDGMPSITESMKAESPYVELVREFLGVAICLIVLIFQYVRSRMHAMRSVVRTPSV